MEMDYMQHIKYMKRALELAENARGFTEPNPLVGAVIVKNGEIVGEGYHKKAGTPHAEVHALAAAGEKSRGATMYVTLEPCSHYGKTPPCANAVVKSGITRVFIALEDPNPLVNGKGIQILKDAGIEVHTGMLRQEAIRQNCVFLTNQIKKRAYIALKSAQTIDGKIGPANGCPVPITGKEARIQGHTLRRDYGAVLVGIQTILKDDPLLNIRYDIPHIDGKPVRIVLDPHMKLPLNGRLLTQCKEPTLIYTTTEVSSTIRSKIEGNGGCIVTLPEKSGGMDSLRIAVDLYERGICSVLVEGGASTLTHFFQADLWDEYHCFIAPKFMGKHGISVYADDSDDLTDLNCQVESELCGNDIHVIYRNKNGVESCLQELSKRPANLSTSDGIHLVRR